LRGTSDAHERNGSGDEAFDVVPRQHPLDRVQSCRRQPALRRSGTSRVRDLAQRRAERASFVAQAPVDERHLPTVHLVQLDGRALQLAEWSMHELRAELDDAPQLAIPDAVDAAPDAIARFDHQPRYSP